VGTNGTEVAEVTEVAPNGADGSLTIADVLHRIVDKVGFGEADRLEFHHAIITEDQKSSGKEYANPYAIPQKTALDAIAARELEIAQLRAQLQEMEIEKLRKQIAEANAANAPAVPAESSAPVPEPAPVPNTPSAELAPAVPAKTKVDKEG
jgi:F420-dependent methylenetetrahydromethanopterin dehydrogenase